MESTENIYKYHMQMQGGIVVPAGTKIPPAPLVQTPVSAGSHSRSSSHASSQSTNVKAETLQTQTQSQNLEAQNNAINVNNKTQTDC